MSALIPEVVSLHDAAWAQHIQSLLDDKTKPVGSLGVLEQLAYRIACILGSDAPVLDRAQPPVAGHDSNLCGSAQKGRKTQTFFNT